MHFTKCIVLFTILITAHSSEAKRKHRAHNKVQVEQHNGMYIVRQRSLKESSAVQTLSPSSYDNVFSDWSSWAKCRRSCKQVRRRYCLKEEVCGNNILKEERSCTGHRCRKQKTSPLLSTNSTQQLPYSSKHQQNHQIQNPDRANTRVLYQLQSLIYSEWSSWSSCKLTCQTERTRNCVLEELCHNKIVHEYAICYIPGTDCEKKFQNIINAQLPREEERYSFQSLESNWEKNPNGKRRIINNGTLIDDATCGQPANMMGPLLRIIGGRESSLGRWPWMVAVLNNNHDAFCGGTLVTSEFVITAAHCVRKNLRIRAGEHDLSEDEETEQEVSVVQTFTHPEYNLNTVDNDVALLKLKRPLRLNKYVSPVCLPKADDVMADNSKGTILGWGKRMSDAMIGTVTLHAARVPIANTDDCKKVYDKYYISDNMVCAGYKRGKVDSCAGDSGGPLLFRKKDTNRWNLYGITSFGEGCGRRGKYGIYAKVPNFVQWIRETIETHASK